MNRFDYPRSASFLAFVILASFHLQAHAQKEGPPSADLVGINATESATTLNGATLAAPLIASPETRAGFIIPEGPKLRLNAAKKAGIIAPRTDAYMIIREKKFVRPSIVSKPNTKSIAVEGNQEKPTSSAKPAQATSPSNTDTLSYLEKSAIVKEDTQNQAALFDGNGKYRAPRIAIIGGAIAGTAALEALALRGLHADLYEAHPYHFGGRVWSEEDPQTGLILEAGAELVHTNDYFLKQRLKRYGITLINRSSQSSKHYFHIGDKAILYQPFMNMLFSVAGPQLKKIKEDRESIGAGATRDYAYKKIMKIDRTSIKEYLDENHAPPLLRTFIHMIVSPEYGYNDKALSAQIILEAIKICSLKSRKINIYPLRKEAHKVLGGTQRIIDAVIKQFAGSVHLGHKLVSVKSDDAKTFLITLDTPEDRKTMEVDQLFNSIPFPSLHGIRQQIPGFTDAMKREIRRVNYGSNGKLIMLFSKRIWREKGYPGEGFSDLGLSYWDGSEGQEQTPAGAITALVDSSQVDPTQISRFASQLAGKFLKQLETAYHGITDTYLGYRFYDWHTSFSGSDKPGHRTGLYISADSIGNYHQIGEFFGASEEDQSFMEGAQTSVIRPVRSVPGRIRIVKK